MKLLNSPLKLVFLWSVAILLFGFDLQAEDKEIPTDEETAEVSEGETPEVVPEQSTPVKTKKMYSELNLTKEQKKQILDIKKKTKASIADAREAIKAAKAAYQTVFDAVGSDSDLSDKFQSLQTTRQTLADARFQQMLKIRAVLNEEQKKKFHELKAEFRKKTAH